MPRSCLAVEGQRGAERFRRCSDLPSAPYNVPSVGRRCRKPSQSTASAKTPQQLGLVSPGTLLVHASHSSSARTIYNSPAWMMRRALWFRSTKTAPLSEPAMTRLRHHLSTGISSSNPNTRCCECWQTPDSNVLISHSHQKGKTAGSWLQ